MLDRPNAMGLLRRSTFHFNEKRAYLATRDDYRGTVSYILNYDVIYVERGACGYTARDNSMKIIKSRFCD